MLLPLKVAGEVGDNVVTRDGGEGKVGCSNAVTIMTRGLNGYLNITIIIT